MIREANLQDMEELLALSLIMCDSSPNYNREPDTQRMTEVLRNRILDKDAFVFVSEKDFRLNGMIFGRLVPFLYTKGSLVTEEIWFSLPSAGFGAVTLLKKMIEWAISKEALEVTLGVTTGIKDQRVAGLLRLYGFQRIGSNYRFGGSYYG